MNSRTLVRLRLRNQQISLPALRDPGEVVARLCAMQAQDVNGALWAVGLRTHGATEGDVLRAIADRAVIRTWLLRGTLHLVAAEDVRWILALVRPRIQSGMAGRHRQLGLSRDIFARSRQVLSDGLEGGRQLTREEVFRLFETAGISPEGQRGYHLLAMAGLEGVICYGPNRMRQQTFVLLDEWAPESGRQPEPEKSPALLAERYIAGHGPATPQDFAWWSGLTLSGAKAGLAGARLESLRVEGKEYFIPVKSGTYPEEGETVLLPGYDEYLVGYRDRSAALDPALAAKTVIGSNGVMLPTIVINGIVAGTWKRTIGKRDLSAELRPFSPLSRARRRDVEAAAERYGTFMGLPVICSW